MANKTRFYIAESSIKSFFKQSAKRIYSQSHLETILEENRTIWNLPFNMNCEKFIEKLIHSGIIKKREIKFEGYISNKVIFIHGDVSIFDIAVSLINKSYLSHFSAAFILGLTTQVPKTVYLTFEQSKKQNRNFHLEQKAIDYAFSKPQKLSETKSIIDDYTIVIHNAMDTNRAGVFTNNSIAMTNIERTLIDITVRPNYAGGVNSVLEIYRNSIDKISINKLVAILDNIAYIYPYHQAIGFYLEKAGYTGERLNILRKKEKPNDFYLSYNMTEKEYSPEWKLYYPRGL